MQHFIQQLGLKPVQSKYYTLRATDIRCSAERERNALPARIVSRTFLGSHYELEVQERQEREAQQLANLTGWDIDEIRERIPALADLRPEEEPWWVRIWN